MLILPIRTDRPLRHRPVVNYAIIIANVMIFLLIYYILPGMGKEEISRQLLDSFQLKGIHPHIYQFITYAFLHADWAHLIGNMLFLYIFGNSINDKMGDMEYALFYAAGAIFSGAGYILISPNNLVGASGAIAAVTTAFLVLFPRSNVLVVVWIFWFIDTFEFSSLILIGIKMILLDNIIFPTFFDSGSNVAHGAHLIGYLFGFFVPLLLMAVKALGRDQFDILALWSRMIRRRQFAASQFGHVQRPNAKYARPVRFNDTSSSNDSETNIPSEFSEPRNDIDLALQRYDFATAAELYLKLLSLDNTQILHQKQQLDIANQLMSEHNYQQAADAYEKLLSKYPKSQQIEQIQLLLGVIYSRYLKNPKRAKNLFDEAKRLLKDPVQLQLCENELANLNLQN